MAEPLAPPEEAVNLDALGEPEAEEVDPEVEASPIVDPPKKSRSRSRRKPPANIGEPVLEMAVILRLISFGKSVSNVTATLGFEMPGGVPVDMAEHMGEHAYAATFRGDYLGEGLTIRSETTSVDAENEVKKAFKVMLPRWNNGADQLAAYIAPLLPDEVTIDGLLGLSAPWRLNVTVEMGGVFAIHPMQQSFDLTAKAE